MWQIRRLLLGDRRKSDRVVNEARAALRRLDQALSAVDRPELDYDHRRNADDR